VRAEKKGQEPTADLLSFFDCQRGGERERGEKPEVTHHVGHIGMGNERREKDLPFTLFFPPRRAKGIRECRLCYRTVGPLRKQRSETFLDAFKRKEKRSAGSDIL